MTLTYDKVLTTIRQAPDARKDFEVNNLLPWFRKKSQLFANLKTELLFDIIKNLQFMTKIKDEIIIKQGDQGDCLYILLRGQVTIYILYNKVEGDGDDGGQPIQTTAKGGESLRQQLGTFVTHLGAGATFGEVALLKEDDCIRTASIIADETCDLIVVDRQLYNRSVKFVLLKEFEDKQNFIATSPFFHNWAAKYRKQLAMALQKESLPYEGVLAKQGEKVDAIYFILSGEIKVVMDASMHKAQYPKIFAQDVDIPQLTNGEHENPDQEEVEELLKSMSSGGVRGASKEASQFKFRKKPQRKVPQEVCLLGVNESIGDVEVLLDLDTFLQTAICTQRTELLVLEMKHYERLFVRRNPRTIEAMKEALELKLKSRISKHLEKCVPVMKALFCKAEEQNQQRQQQSEARQNWNQEKHAVKHAKTMSETFDSFVPPRGALVDMYGPGTVFYRIRERDKVRQAKLRRKNQFGGTFGATNQRAETRFQEPGMGAGWNGSAQRGRQPTMAADYQTSDPVLSNLENRMRQWLSNDPSHKAPPRVAKLHRSQTETAPQKPVGRPTKDADGEPLSPTEADDDKVVYTGHSWV